MTIFVRDTKTSKLIHVKFNHSNIAKAWEWCDSMGLIVIHTIVKGLQND